MTPPRGVHNQLLQRALGMRQVPLGGAPELHGAADVISAGDAEVTGLARLADFERHMVADLQPSGIRPDSSDNACGLVAEGKGLPHLDVAVTEVAEVVEVGPTQACGLDGDLDVARGEGGEGPLFLLRWLGRDKAVEGDVRLGDRGLRGGRRL